LLRLALLAPTIVELNVDGRHPGELALSMLMKPFPQMWSEQSEALLCQAQSHLKATAIETEMRRKDSSTALSRRLWS